MANPTEEPFGPIACTSRIVIATVHNINDANSPIREHIIDKLCIVIPGGAVEEVCLGFFSTLLLWAVNCNAELAEGCLACVAEFGVGSKSACFDSTKDEADPPSIRSRIYPLNFRDPR